MYRVVRISTDDFGVYNRKGPSVVTEATIWSGPSIERMSEEFPPSSIDGADPLEHGEIEDGMFRFDYRFEKLSGDVWVKIDDPRVRLSSDLTEAEKAQDAENRRLYPGDYLTEDDYCYYCGYPGCFGDCQEFDDGVIFDHDQGKFVYRDSN